MINKSLFTSYAFNQPQPSAEDGDDLDAPDSPPWPSFQINLAFLLETLQILGTMDSTKRSEAASISTGHYGRAAAAMQGGVGGGPAPFSDRALGLPGTCILTYEEEGSPLSITIEESCVKTTASLTTYVPEIPEEIPFHRDELVFKIIMQPRALANTLTDFSTLAADRLAVEVRARPQPRLALYGKGGDCGVTIYDFAGGRRDMLESIVVSPGEEGVGEGFLQTYRFELVKAASEAMKIANKLSLRGDRQGVLSLQFMVEVEGGEASYMDFRLVPDAGIGEESEGEGNERDEEMDDE